jgi:asparagine synthetase B (glutamine-hydrolysing)
VGGLDSSIVGVLSNQFHYDKIPFYTSTMPQSAQKRENRQDDLPFVKQLADQHRIPLHIHAMSENTAGYLPQMV